MKYTWYYACLSDDIVMEANLQNGSTYFGLASYFCKKRIRQQLF